MFDCARVRTRAGAQFRPDALRRLGGAPRLRRQDILNTGGDAGLAEPARQGPYNRQDARRLLPLDEAACRAQGQMNTRFEIARAIGSSSAVLFRLEGPPPTDGRRSRSYRTRCTTNAPPRTSASATRRRAPTGATLAEESGTCSAVVAEFMLPLGRISPCNADTSCRPGRAILWAAAAVRLMAASPGTPRVLLVLFPARRVRAPPAHAGAGGSSLLLRERPNIAIAAGRHAADAAIP